MGRILVAGRSRGRRHRGLHQRVPGAVRRTTRLEAGITGSKTHLDLNISLEKAIPFAQYATGGTVTDVYGCPNVHLPG